MATTPYRVVTPPAREPLGLEEAKGHLRVDIQEDDILISNLIVAARETVENRTDRKLIDTVVLFTHDFFPGGPGHGCGSAWEGYIPKSLRGVDKIEFPLAPVTEVTAFKYIDDNGAEQELAADTGYVYKAPTLDSASVEPVWGEQWPVARSQTGALTIEATVGYGPTPASVPRIAKQAMLLFIGAWYAHREELILGVQPFTLPDPVGVESLIRQLRWKVY